MTTQEALEKVRQTAKDNGDAMIAYGCADEGVEEEANNAMRRVVKRALQVGCDMDAIIRAQWAGFREAGLPVAVGR